MFIADERRMTKTSAIKPAPHNQRRITSAA
jgi:hypothetical protein